MSRTGIAIIGLGPASEPHTKSVIDLKDRIELRWAIDRNPERCTAAERAYRFRTATNPQIALTDPAVSLVLVLTPPAAHLPVAEQCFAAGKHVLVEKPLALTADVGAELIAAARRAGKVLGVVLQHRFRDGARRLAALVAAGELGDIAAASLTVPWWRPQSYYDVGGRGTLARDGGGVLLTQAIHALDLFRSLVGVRKVVAARVTTTPLHRMETEDFAAALLELGNGAPGTLIATTAMYPGAPERIEIVGTRATAWLDGGTLKVCWLDGREERVEGEARTGGGANIMDFPHDAHRALLADVVAAVETGSPLAVSPEDALATQRLIEEIVARGQAG